MDAAISLLSDRNVQAYFVVLGLAIHCCTKIYFSTSKDHKPLPTDQIKEKGHKSNISSKAVAQTSRTFPSIIPLFFSVTIIGVTWFLILRFILTNLHTSTSYFDDAYKDVLRTSGHFFTSTQLLTWAIVAVVWIASEGCIERDVFFLLFGFLGAMGAAFVVWVPTLYRRDQQTSVSKQKKMKSMAVVNKKHDTSVPITYVITSIIAFISILKLKPCNPDINECTPEEGFGQFTMHFRRWLQCLHVILVAPVFVSLILPSQLLPRVPSSLLFGAFAVVFGCWHLYQVKIEGCMFTIPRTDCQISITTDLVCCSCITLYAIYKDTVKAGQRYRMESDDAVFTSAFRRLCLSAIVMPLVSPAAVLAGHLCMYRFHAMYASFIAQRQKSRASEMRRSGNKDTEDGIDSNWCNLGLWAGDECTYNKACENLAHALGKLADLNSNDAVLSCGCGSIDEVRYFKQKFGLRHITGIDAHLPQARTTDIDDFNVRTIRASVEDLGMDENKAVLFPPRMFDKIVALDNIYHYQCKQMFFRDCLAMLPGNGQVAVSDIVLRQSQKNTPTWVKVVLKLMNVSITGLWSADEYLDHLKMLGYKDIKTKLVGEDVFKGWTILPASLLQYIDYALIVAKKPGDKDGLSRKKRIAIIGSGLAGLSTAHSLLSSHDGADFDVDIYEANEDCPGLAGNTHLIGEQLVDVPARMACIGYYNEYCQLLEELGIPSTVVRTDSSFYGDDGHGLQVCYSYDRNSLVNLYNAVRIGGVGKLWRLAKALSKLTGQNGQGNISFGEWLKVNLDLTEEKTYQCNTTGSMKEHDIPSLTCYNNPFVYVMAGALSWMLSCTWADLLQYPADVILPYCCGLKMSRLGVGRQGQVIRILPSIKALERTLLYGVKNLHLGSRVSSLESSKLINGQAYDAVVVATEAKAVPKVIKNPNSNVFGDIKYHPSTIYLHTDESFMPPNKKDWKCWNVEMSSGRQGPQLTFWLNEFYPNAHFDSNVFQTWAPSHTPKEGTIIKRSDFERVVHSDKTQSYVDAIEDIQGQDGFYYAGSYCVYGMGLLEEALISGKYVAEGLIKDLVLATPKQPILNALVIGAGPSGLVCAKYLSESLEPSYNMTILEESNIIGGSFTNKVYDNCRLVSSKYLTAFSDYRMPEDTEQCPDHPSAEQYVKYLQSYTDHFDLMKYIKFGCRVVSIQDAGTGAVKGSDCEGYNVQYKSFDGQIVSKHYDVVAVCSGLHNIPYIPRLFVSSPSENKKTFAEKFKGEIIHSSQYKDSSIFANKRVLILGSGETAMDLAHRAVLHPMSKSVALCVRNGFLSIPHNLAKDRPLDVFITNLFEHAYEHPFVAKLRLRWILSTLVIRIFLFLTGSSLGFNQWAVHTTPVRRGYHIINKSHAAMSHLNVPIKQMSIWGRFWLWIYNEQNLRPIISYHQTQVTDVEDDGITVRFCDGSTFKADLIVLATGYKQSFPFLDNKIQKEFREESLHKNLGSQASGKYEMDEDYLPSKHFIVGESRPRLGFIGFVRPNVGAIPPMSELQVMWWLEMMRDRVKMLKSTGQSSYMVLGRKYPYGVDYGNYMHRVAEDFDAAPSLYHLAKSSNPLRALYTYCIGQSFISMFRLQGPYESRDCWDVVVGELWRVCMKRGWAENMGLLIMTWLSLWMNLAACGVELLWCSVTLRRPKFFVRY